MSRMWQLLIRKPEPPTRIGYEVRDGKKVRVARKSGEIIPEPGRIVKTKKEEAPGASRRGEDGREIC